MRTEYNVYRSAKNNRMILSVGELKEVRVFAKNKYVGKKAKIEAIKRMSGKILPESMKTKEVGDYLRENMFYTTEWEAYRKVLQEVANEKITITEDFVFLYAVEVEFKDNMNLRADDKKVMGMIADIIVEGDKEEYQEMKKEVVSIQRK